MLHMIEVKYTQEHRDTALAYFQEHGMTHYDGGLVVKGLWVSTTERTAYALVEAANPAEVDAACRPLEEFGEVEHRAVITADEL